MIETVDKTELIARFFSLIAKADIPYCVVGDRPVSLK